MSKGLFLFTLGLSKKVLLADVFGNLVNLGYENIETLNSFTAVLVILGYTFQIYFDFSGYSDMAIGLGWLMNIDLPVNFDSPYKALTVTEFWKKWHMTLTSFFRKYVYIPLGGSRNGKVRTYINVIVVFLLSGLWHGAGWQFILWGLLHGIAQLVERIMKKIWVDFHPVFSWLMAFGFINIAWVYFRASSVSKANELLLKLISCDFNELDISMAQVFWLPEWKVILTTSWLESNPNVLLEVFYIFAFIILLGVPNAKKISEKLVKYKITSIVTAVLFVFCLISLSGKSTFLYFNF